MEGILTRKLTSFPTLRTINIRLLIMLLLLIVSFKNIFAQPDTCPNETNLDVSFCELSAPSTFEDVMASPYNMEISETILVESQLFVKDNLIFTNCAAANYVVEREIIIYYDANFNFQYDIGEEVTGCTFFLDCPQESITGCPYEEALNYNPEANCDDGSCSYKNCHIDDWTALKAFYESTYVLADQGVETHLWGWDDFFNKNIPPPACDFSNLSYVELDLNGRVNKIELSNRSIVGTIPSEFEKLNNLTLLDLWGNRLTGNIPSSLGNLENLVYLDLSDNQFFGSLPANLSNLTNLQALGLAYNNFSGCYQEELFNLCSVDGLAFGDTGTPISTGNNFVGSWPSFCDNREGTCVCNNYTESSKEEHFLCENESITIQAENVNIDAQSESELAYILHDGYGSLGDIEDINSTGFYVNDGSFPRGKQLYVSPVVRPTVSYSLPILEDCTFIAFPGTPILFVEPITGWIESGDCEGLIYSFSYSFSGGFGEQFEIGGSLTATITDDETNFGSVSFDEETFTLIATDKIGCSATLTGDNSCCNNYPCYIQEPAVPCNDGDPCTVDDFEILDACTGAVCMPCAGTPIDCNCDFISGELFIDSNNNGCKDVNEIEGIAGVEVTIWECDLMTGRPEIQIGSTITDNDGFYTFGDVLAPFTGTDNIVYQVCCEEECRTGVINIVIDDAPLIIITDTTATVPPGDTVNIPITELIMNNSVCEDDELEISLIGEPTMGVAILNEDGSIDYTAGSDMVTYHECVLDLMKYYVIQFDLPDGYMLSEEVDETCPQTNTNDVQASGFSDCITLYSDDSNHLHLNAGLVPINSVTIICPETTDLGTYNCNIDEIPLPINTIETAMSAPYNLSIEGAIETTRAITEDSDIIFYCEEDARTITRKIIIYNDDNINFIYDEGEEIGSCEFFIYTIPDITPPIFFAPSDITTNCIDGYDPNITGFPTSDDGCPRENMDEYTFYSDEITNGACLGEFIVTRSWTVTDVCGNISETQIQLITVECTDECTELQFCNGNIEEQILGCTDGMACNYNPDAICDDGSCVDFPICNSDPCMGDVTVLSADGCTCEFMALQVLGCTDGSAINYNSEANCDDGSCIEAIFDLALIKEIATSQSTPIYPGDDVTFTISVYNQGNVEATNFTITDYIPAGMILNDADWTAGDMNATTTIAGPLAPGESTSVDITLTYNSTAAGDLVNYAEISSANYITPDGETITDSDSTPDNEPNNDTGGEPISGTDNVIDNEGGDEDDHDPALITIDAFDLAISKEVAPDTPTTLLSGDEVTFVLTVFNQGSIPAQNISLADYIPDGLILNDIDWILDANGTSINSIPDPIAPGGSASVNITFTIDIDFSGQIRNVVEITRAEDANGNTPDDIDSTFGNGDSNGEEDDDDSEIINVAVFDLALTKTLADGQPSLFVPNQDVIFTITVFNQGTVDAYNIEIADYIPAGLILNDDRWIADNDNSVTYNIAGPIAAGSSASVNITLTVDTSEPVDLTNFAEIISAQDINSNVLNDIDSNSDNNPVNDSIIDDVTNNFQGDEDDSDIETIAVGCSNYAGTVSPIAEFLCDGETRSVISTGAFLPAGASLFYVLHNEADTFGSIVAINQTGIFENNDTYPRGIQYYVSAVVTEDIDGTPNFDDPCLDITIPGTPVVFLDAITIDVTTSVCDGGTGKSTIKYSFDGGLPAYDGSAYNVSSTIGVFDSSTNSLEIPEGTGTYTITVSDGQQCTATFSDTYRCDGCANDAGTPNEAQFVCAGDTANGVTNNPIIDRGILAYILHEGIDSIENIIGANYSGLFTNDGTYNYNTQYYISAVVGPVFPPDTIPYLGEDSPCTKISLPGTPITFVEPIISYLDATCNETNGETTITYSFSGGFGTGFEISSNDTNNTLNSGDTATLILQTGNATYQLLATDELGCTSGISVIYNCGEEGCTDLCSGNYNSEATLDDGTCEPYDTTCNTECLEGDITVWDEMTCDCIIESVTVLGCTDATACNYNPEANCDDGSCKPFPFCNADPCVGDVTKLNDETCECDLDEPQVEGCTDPEAVNYMPDANCDDGSCIAIDFKLLLKKELSTLPPYLPGDTITYTLTIQNEGNIAASNIEVSDIVPDGLAFDSSALNNSNWDFANDTVKITILDTLTVSDSLKVDITFIIEDTPPENITNIGEISKAEDSRNNAYPNPEPEIEIPDNEIPIEVASKCHRQDISALRDFYLSTNGTDWINRQGWEIFDNGTIPQDCDLSTFYGIGVDDDFRVSNINLSSNGLTGEVPNYTNLPNLITLDLSYNGLSGNIPSLDSLTNLGYLYLNNNYFEGEIPPSHNQLPLQVVDVSVNLLEGVIPNYDANTFLSIDSNRYWFNELKDYFDNDHLIDGTIYSPQFYGDTLVITKDSAEYVLIDKVLTPQQQRDVQASDFEWIKYNPYIGENKVSNEMYYEIESIQPSDAGRHHLHIADEDKVPGLEMISLPVHLFVAGYDEIGEKSEEGQVIFEGVLPDNLRKFVIDSCSCNRGLYLLQMETDSAANKLIIRINTEEHLGSARGSVDGNDVDSLENVSSKNYPFGQDAIINDGPVFRYNLQPSQTNSSNTRLFILDTGLDNYDDSFNEVLFEEAPLDLCYPIPKAPGYGYIHTSVTIDYQDLFGHGTYGSWSIIEDMTENIDLIPLKVFNKDKQGRLFKMICALYHAIDHEANIVNISAGYKGVESLVLRNAIQLAARKKVFVVAAAGNDSSNIDLNPQYPAAFAADDSFKNVISVVSIDSNNELSFFSNYSPTFESIAAYGENIEGYGLERACVVANGTSISTYFVSKALSIELAKDTSRSVIQARSDFTKNMLVPEFKLMDTIQNGLRLYTELQSVTDDNKCCYTPFVVIQDQVDCHTASFRWDDLLIRQHYTIRYRRLNDTTNFDGKHPRYCEPSEWITITRFESNVTLERLSEDSMYEVQFQTICNNKVSSFSEPIFFKTNKVEDCVGNFKGITNLQLLLYPNPTQDYLNLFFTNSTKDEKEIYLQISDSNGKIVQSENYAIDPEGNSYCINVSHLASGLYYLLFYNDSFSIHYKVIVI